MMDAQKGLFLLEEESLKDTGEWRQFTLFARGWYFIRGHKSMWQNSVLCFINVLERFSLLVKVVQFYQNRFSSKILALYDFGFVKHLLVLKTSNFDFEKQKVSLE